MNANVDVVVVGAGAAGLMCAIEAGKRGRRVLLIEGNHEIGEKIRISGGGRCNFTNSGTAPAHYLCANPHFCISALARFTPDDFVAIVERHGITFHEKKLGQLFCDDSSRRIIDALKQECNDAGVEILTGCPLTRVVKADDFTVVTKKGEIHAESLVIATGGLSIPKLGATDIGYRIADQFGIRNTATKPGLVPFVFSGEDLSFCSDLSGVSVDSLVECNGQGFRENILFTHRGLSGPAILQISSYWNSGDNITINLSPDVDVDSLLRESQQSDLDIATVLSTILPRRFAQKWCARYANQDPLHRQSLASLAAIANHFHSWQLVPDGTEGYGKAEVTCGGVDTDELSSKTMESRKVPGLFFIGEVVDVTGHLGGHNFQWAWASGFVAGQYA